MEKISLSKGILVNGEELKEINLDFDAVTTEDFCSAAGEASVKAAEAGGVSVGSEFDSGFHLAIALRAACRGTKGLDLLDAKRIVGRDVLKFARAGRVFCFSLVAQD